MCDCANPDCQLPLGRCYLCGNPDEAAAHYVAAKLGVTMTYPDGA